MKNLKKVLSLILVVAMACSFMMFASAKDYEDFTDAADISDEYLEAVDVAAALEIFVGDDTGALDPQGNFTRAQAAKIVTYMSIGKSAAEALAATGGIFGDVPAYHWASKYIAYAYNAGILNGDGDGNFRPEDSVTGAEVAKLMNTVLGYGKKGEYVGASWQINAISDGISRGLVVNVGDLTAPALREEVIQAVFNTIRPEGARVGIQNKMVEYSNIINGYVFADGDGGTWATPNVNKSSLGRYIFNLTFNGFDDNSGYPVHNWKIGAVIISDVYPDAPAAYRSTDGSAIYTTAPFFSTIDLQSKFNLVFHTLAARGATVFYNGIAVFANVNDVAMLDAGVNATRRAAAQKIVDDFLLIGAPTPAEIAAEAAAQAELVIYDYFIGNVGAASKRGVIVDIYLDYEGYVERIVIIEKTAARITSNTLFNSFGGVTNISGITEHVFGYVTYAGDTTLVKGDVALWYIDAASVLHIEKLAPVEGQLTRYTTATYTVAFGGDNYSLSNLTGHPGVVDFDKKLDETGTDGDLRKAANYNKDAAIYVDDNGSILYFNPPSGALPQYMYVLAVSEDGFGNMDKVRAIFTDGTIKVVNAVDAIANYPADTVKLRVTNAATAQWVSYGYDEANNLYTLTTLLRGAIPAAPKPAATVYNTRTAIGGAATPQTAPGRTAFLTVGAGSVFGAGVADRMIGDSSTVFIFYNPAAGGSAKAYVGINSIPNLELRATDMVNYINVGPDIYDDYVLIETDALAYDDIYSIFAMRNQSMTDYFGVANINAYENVIINGTPVAKPWFDTTSAIGVPEVLLGLYQAKVREVNGEKVHLITTAGERSIGGRYQDMGNYAINIYDAANNLVSAMPFNVAASLPMYLVSPVNLNVPQKFEYDTMKYFVPAYAADGVTPIHYNIFWTVDPLNATKITAIYFVPDNGALSTARAVLGNAYTPTALTHALNVALAAAGLDIGDVNDILTAAAAAPTTAIPAGGSIWQDVDAIAAGATWPAGVTFSLAPVLFPATPALAAQTTVVFNVTLTSGTWTYTYPMTVTVDAFNATV